MKSLMVALALAVGLSVYAALPAGAREKADQKPTSAQIQDLNLTDEQEARIAEIRKDFRPRVQEARKELAAVGKEEVEKVRAVLTPDQKTKLAAQKEERQEYRAERLAERIAHLGELDLTEAEVARIAEIRKEFHPRMVKALEGLQGILSDEQRKAREEGLKAGKRRRDIVASLNLSGDQKAKVEAVCKELRTLHREELEAMRNVLDEGQKEKVQELREERRERVRDRMAHRIANLRDLNLTEEQRTKITDIRKEYRPRVHEAGNKLRGIVREEVEQIVAVLKQ
jgi:Spy/CpxP family protein refolding chaperone